MNKKESKIILDTYKNVLYVHELCKIDKDDTRRELKNLLDALGMKKERYTIENEIISERDSFNYTIKEMYSLIFETFLKYGKYINYNMDEIDRCYYNLKYELTEEENKCYQAQIKYILNNK